MYYIRREVVRAAIAGLEKHENILTEEKLYIWKDEALLLLWLLERKWLTEKMIRGGLHKGICLSGRKSYEQHTKLGHPPDHTTSPMALGYACLYEAVTPREAKKIRFDHGETLEEYKERAKDLVDRVFPQIAIRAAEEDRFPIHTSVECHCC